MVEMAESPRALGVQEEKDLKKFLKFLSLKAVQVIVQSCLGEKIHTKSKSNFMGQDWFNLAINDHPDVAAEVKKVTSGRLPSKESPVCVEISLKTNEALEGSFLYCIKQPVFLCMLRSPVANNIAAVDPGAEGGHASSTLHGGWGHPICHTRCRGRSQEEPSVYSMVTRHHRSFNFSSTVHMPGDLNNPSLQVNSSSPPSVVEGGAQVKQMINVEAIMDFNGRPLLDLQFSVNGLSQRIVLPMPLFLSKFFTPTEMTSQGFFSRWKQLGNPDQECQKIFQARFPIDTETIKTKLVGFGMSLLQNVDPNPENFVCAGIIKARSVQMGTLLRLEPNRQAQMFRLTLRSSRGAVSQMLGEILEDQF